MSPSIVMSGVWSASKFTKAHRESNGAPRGVRAEGRWTQFSAAAPLFARRCMCKAYALLHRSTVDARLPFWEAIPGVGLRMSS